MTTYLVTRHQGAVDWATHSGFAFDTHLTHLPDELTLQTGDVVAGSLPINIVADLCEKGVTYLHLSLRIPENLRGVELTQEQLDNLDARLEAFDVRRVSR